MTIDERLEKLAERHEALTQSVEILRLNGEEQAGRIEELRKLAEEQTKQIELLLGTAKQGGENIRALARIADMRDRGLSELEQGRRQ